ncbi:cytochrome P450 [Xylaria digitata]|nr:cytochrome P450 [Xylaria digitata]
MDGLVNVSDGRGINLAAVITVGIIVFFAVQLIQSYFRLRHIPGPPTAAITNLSRRSWASTGSLQEKQIELHRQYGPVVRVGPNAVHICKPSAIDQIFGFKARFAKSEFYEALMPRMKGGKIPDVFATRDENVHRQMRRPIANLYSIANLAAFEPLILSTMEYFFSRLDELFVDTSKTFDLCDWLQLFTFDVMGEITFSRRFGFLEKGGDIEGVMGNIWKFFQIAAPNTQMPWLDQLWKENPLVPVSAMRNPIAEFGAARIQERLGRAANDTSETIQKDFLSSFIGEVEKDPSLPELALPTWTNSNIQAGGDTTSILASAVLYNVLRDRSTFVKLMDEIKCAAREGRISKMVTWKEAQTLPYLDACIKEASRLHPSISFPLERVVSEAGLEVEGILIPPGTRVSMNPWVVHRQVGPYGDDPDVWRPERWLCGEEEKKAMYNSLLTFGAGHRGCLGKNLSYFEIYKLVPSMLQRYDMELVDAKDWSVDNKWFAMPSGCHIKIRRRE